MVHDHFFKYSYELYALYLGNEGVVPSSQIARVREGCYGM